LESFRFLPLKTILIMELVVIDRAQQFMALS